MREGAGSAVAALTKSEAAQGCVPALGWKSRGSLPAWLGQPAPRAASCLDPSVPPSPPPQAPGCARPCDAAARADRCRRRRHRVQNQPVCSTAAGLQNPSERLAVSAATAAHAAARGHTRQAGRATHPSCSGLSMAFGLPARSGLVMRPGWGFNTLITPGSHQDILQSAPAAAAAATRARRSCPRPPLGAFPDFGLVYK